MRRGRESGQAAVETALTLPLTIFMILGTLQLFMMLQARVMAQYAIGRAVRAGSLHHGNCEVMKQTAIAALVPTFRSFAKPTIAGTTKANRYGKIVERQLDNQYDPLDVSGHNRPVIWFYRDSPVTAELPTSSPNAIEEEWDVPSGNNGALFNLGAHMIFWYPLRIPFANWVISNAVLAHQNIQAFNGYDPANPTRAANWTGDSGAFVPDGSVASEFNTRVALKQYVVPIRTSAVMRMMTPPRGKYINAPCAGP